MPTRRDRAAPDMLPLRLTPQEHELLCRTVRLPLNLAHRLRQGRPEDDMLVFDLSPEDLIELVRYLRSTPNLSATTGKGGNLEEVAGRVGGLLEMVGDVVRGTQGSVVLAPGLPADVRDRVQAIMDDPTVVTPELMQVRLLEAMADLQGEPQLTGSSGLSPREVMELIDRPWEGEDAVVRLSDSLTFEQVKDTMYYRCSRIILETILEAQSVKATPSGRLNRKMVLGLLERMGNPDELLATGLLKVIDEDKVREVHYPRVLLQTAGLIKIRKGEFTVTKRGEALLPDSEAGLFHATLFRTLFRKVNLAYFDRGHAIPAIQEFAAFALYQMKRLGDDWRDREFLTRELLPEAVRMQVPQPQAPYRDPAIYYVSWRILHPLRDFGLIERRVAHNDNATSRDCPEFRKTPLFDQFISFNIR